MTFSYVGAGPKMCKIYNRFDLALYMWCSFCQNVVIHKNQRRQILISETDDDGAENKGMGVD